MNERPIDLRWGAYALKMVLALLWLITAVPAYFGMMDPDLPAAFRLVLLAVFALPTFVWFALTHSRLRSQDEFEVRLLSQGLAFSALFVIAWIAFILGSRVVMDLIDADRESGSGLIAVVPPLVMAMTESQVQLERRRLAKG